MGIEGTLSTSTITGTTSTSVITSELSPTVTSYNQTVVSVTLLESALQNKLVAINGYLASQSANTFAGSTVAGMQNKKALALSGTSIDVVREGTIEFTTPPLLPWTIGKVLFLDTDGDMTFTIPTALSQKYVTRVGVVTRESPPQFLLNINLPVYRNQ